MSRKSFMIVYWAAFAAMIGWSLYRTFTHIDMTRTRLLVTFWPEWLAMGVIVIVLTFLRARSYPRRSTKVRRRKLLNQ